MGCCPGYVEGLLTFFQQVLAACYAQKRKVFSHKLRGKPSHGQVCTCACMLQVWLWMLVSMRMCSSMTKGMGVYTCVCADRVGKLVVSCVNWGQHAVVGQVVLPTVVGRDMLLVNKSVRTTSIMNMVDNLKKKEQGDQWVMQNKMTNSAYNCGELYSSTPSTLIPHLPLRWNRHHQRLASHLPVAVLIDYTTPHCSMIWHQELSSS